MYTQSQVQQSSAWDTGIFVLKYAMHSAALCRTSASEILDLRKKLSYDIFGLTYLELIVYLKLITVDIFSYLWCFDYIGWRIGCDLINYFQQSLYLHHTNRCFGRKDTCRLLVLLVQNWAKKHECSYDKQINDSGTFYGLLLFDN